MSSATATSSFKRDQTRRSSESDKCDLARKSCSWPRCPNQSTSRFVGTFAMTVKPLPPRLFRVDVGDALAVALVGALQLVGQLQEGFGVAGDVLVELADVGADFLGDLRERGEQR